MRNTAFILLGVGLLVLQSNLFWLLSNAPLSGITPNLVLPVVVYMGVNEVPLARGAALCFVLGYLIDLFCSAPVGLYTFISVATFVVTHFAGVRLAAQTWVTRVGLVFGFALVEGLLVVVLTGIFAADATRARWLARLVVPHAVSTALFAPVVYRLSEWVGAATANATKPGEVVK